MRFPPVLRRGRAAGLGLAAHLALAQTVPLTVRNEDLICRWDSSKNAFALSLTARPQIVLKNGALSRGGGAAKVELLLDPKFGPGQAIEVSYPDGNRDEIALFQKLPFAFFRSYAHNGGLQQDRMICRQKTFSATVDLGTAVNRLKALGTDGLVPPDKNPGSYVWLAVADPSTRHGLVFGWITDQRGSGALFSGIRGGAVDVEARIDYGALRIAPGQTEPLEILAVGYFDDARLGLEQWADAVAKFDDIHLPPQPCGYCTWYSKPYGAASDETHLAQQAEFAAKNLAPFGFSVVQIDDHWQAGVSTNGPKRNFLASDPRGPYPSGMKSIASRIRSLGLVPGIWFMPFAGTFYDPYFAPHPDWFVKRSDGSPYETDWGGTCLDMTDPGAQNHLRAVVRQLADRWGFRYFKMDGLWTGTATRQIYVNSGYKDDGMGDAVFHDPRKTNIEAYRDGLRLVRRAVGRKVFLLGCCSPQNMRSYGPAFGMLDAMRIGPDNGARWPALMRGPLFGSRQYFLNGRVWYNDPDPVYVRASIPARHAQLICSWVGLSGQLNMSSDWFPGLPPDRLDILRRILPAHHAVARPVDLFEHEPARIWLVEDARHSPTRAVIGVFNWDSQPRTFNEPLAKIGLDPQIKYAAFDFWRNKLAPIIAGQLRTTLPAQSCQVLAVRPQSDHPMVISTSRHITQGMIDLVAEKWDGQRRLLRGKSRVVGRDPYELRIVTGSPEKNWPVQSIHLSAGDRAAGAQARARQDGALLRLTLDCGHDRLVSWAVQFQ